MLVFDLDEPLFWTNCLSERFIDLSYGWTRERISAFEEIFKRMNWFSHKDLLLNESVFLK